MSISGVDDGSTKQDPAINANKGLLNLKKFETCFDASLEIMANYSADLLDGGKPKLCSDHEMQHATSGVHSVH